MNPFIDGTCWKVEPSIHPLDQRNGFQLTFFYDGNRYLFSRFFETDEDAWVFLSEEIEFAKEE